MFSLTSTHRYYLYREKTDMRKSFDGLFGIIKNHLSENPMSGDVYIFINRSRNKVKLLHWERGGFILYYKRLEQGTFELPPIDVKTRSCYITWSQLVMIIEGVSLKNIHHRKRFISE